MELSAQKESFSNAYLLAIAATVGCSTAKPDPDEDSIDWTLSARSHGNVLLRSPKLDVQLKCTSGADFKGDYLVFSLKRKNYDELRPANVVVPRILVVVVVPERTDEWIAQTETALCLRHCGYWMSLRGHPESKNKTGVTIQVPRRNQFTVGALQGMMKKLSQGILP